MSVGCQIGDGCRPRTTSGSALRRLRSDWAGTTERNSVRTASLSDVVRISLTASETDGCVGHCKFKQYKVPQRHYTHLSWIQGSITHHAFTDSIAYTGDVHWAELQAGLSADCRLSYQPLGHTVTPKGIKGKEGNILDT